MNIVIIGGAQRSGTTLVQTLVANALPNSPILPEAHILYDLLRAWQHAKSEWPKTSKFYGSTQEAVRFFRSAIESHVGDVNARYAGTEYVVLKEPNLITVLSEISEILPAATKIVCVRDPRDIVASFIRIGERQVRLRQETRYSRREVSFICKKINASYLPLVHQDLPPDVILIRYEDVVANPVGALQRLAEKTGLPLNPAPLSAPIWLEDEYRHQETWRTELEGGLPTPENVGGYRRVLSRAELAHVEKACGPLIERLTYVRNTEDCTNLSLDDHVWGLLRRVRSKLRH